VKKSNRHPKLEAKREAALAALRAESERAELDLIRRRLAMPVSKRMNFLRVRVPGGGSYL
jgi:multidrug resistance efflux pump